MQAAVPAPRNFTVAVGGTSVALNPTIMTIPATSQEMNKNWRRGHLLSATRRDRGTLPETKPRRDKVHQQPNLQNFSYYPAPIFSDSITPPKQGLRAAPRGQIGVRSTGTQTVWRSNLSEKSSPLPRGVSGSQLSCLTNRHWPSPLSVGYRFL